MSYIGHPLIGDPVYGRKKHAYGFEGQALHAALLGFEHPATGKYVEFFAEPPRNSKTWSRGSAREMRGSMCKSMCKKQMLKIHNIFRKI